MEKRLLMRSLYRVISRRSQLLSSSSSSTAAAAAVNQVRHLHLNHFPLPTFPPRTLHFDIICGFSCQEKDNFAPASPSREILQLLDSLIATLQWLTRKFSGQLSYHSQDKVSDVLNIGFQSSLTTRIGSIRHFSEDVSHMPEIRDSEIECAFKDLMATNWAELPAAVVHDVKKALSKSTDDKPGQEALLNVFKAAEAVEEFTGILTSIKMEIDDSIGLSGEDVKPMPDELVNALRTVYQRYVAYLDAFGPEEGYLKKKVETELGSKMIHLKMRCSGLGSEWGKVSVLGTSGLAGSYVEQRA